MNDGLLLLHPIELDLDFPKPAQIILQLRKLKLMGDPSPYDEQIFLTGDQFLNQITFMGCSPFIRLEPESATDLGYCYIRLAGPAERPCLRHGRNTRPPICPNCTKRIADWHGLIATPPSLTIECPNCHNRHSIDQLIWKKTAGFGKFFIEIHNIFPGEAVPIEVFLASLNKALGGNWSHFYLLPIQPSP